MQQITLDVVFVDPSTGAVLSSRFTGDNASEVARRALECSQQLLDEGRASFIRSPDVQ